MGKVVIYVIKEDFIKDSSRKTNSMDLDVKFITPMNMKESLKMVLSMGLVSIVQRMGQTHMSMKVSLGTEF